METEGRSGATMMICDVEIPIVEFEGHRVLTLRMIDELHERPEGTARRTFSDHRDRFVCGVHYWKITASVIRTRFPGLIPDRASGEIALISERGYLMLVKPFTDDRSWRVQDMLVEFYFAAMSALTAPPIDPLEVLPNFEDRAAAARSWADQYDARHREKQLRLASEAEKSRLAEAVEVLQPKAAALDKLCDATGTYSMEAAGRVLGIGRNLLFRLLRDHKILMVNNSPYQQYLDAGYFDVIQQSYTPKGQEQARLAMKTVVTPKGIVWLAKRMAVDKVNVALAPSIETKAILETSGLH
jgi:phage antirepressor YoqD-like protein